MVVNLQMTKEYLTHKHWSHIVPGINYELKGTVIMTLNAKTVMSDSQWYTENLFLIKYELDINVYSFKIK